MSADEFEQEWYCSFEASIKGLYYARELAEARRQGRIKQMPYDPAQKRPAPWLPTAPHGRAARGCRTGGWGEAAAGGERGFIFPIRVRHTPCLVCACWR
jgi:hypothetical protein